MFMTVRFALTMYLSRRFFFLLFIFECAVGGQFHVTVTSAANRSMNAPILQTYNEGIDVSICNYPNKFIPFSTRRRNKCVKIIGLWVRIEGKIRMQINNIDATTRNCSVHSVTSRKRKGQLRQSSRDGERLSVECDATGCGGHRDGPQCIRRLSKRHP
jgi:hypothetical protein